MLLATLSSGVHFRSAVSQAPGPYAQIGSLRWRASRFSEETS